MIWRKKKIWVLKLKGGEKYFMKQTLDIWLSQHILERRGPILVLFNPEGKKITLYYMKVPCEKIKWI